MERPSGSRAGVFGKKDVGKLEREFLYWELAVTQTDIIAHYDAISGIHHRKGPSMPRFWPSLHSSLSTTTSTAPSILCV